MDYLAGLAYQASQRTAQAHERFKHGVENYPLSYHSYLGLVELLAAGVAVGDLDRGLTDYYAACMTRPWKGVDRHIANNPGDGWHPRTIIAP